MCIRDSLTYVPYLAAAGELKTKPTQHSVKELQSVGIQPDVLVLRAEHPLSDGPVSYTHLDVYKRQCLRLSISTFSGITSTAVT